MAQIGSARVLQLLRGARKPRQPRRVSGPAAPPLGAVTPLPESKEQTCMVIPCSPCQPMAASSTCTPSLSRRSLRRQSSEIRAVCAIAKPESTYPETTAFKSTRPSGSGDIEQNSTGHSYSGFALTNLLAVFCILSWRVFWLTMTNRTAPDSAPELVFTDLELRILDRLVKDNPSADRS